MKTSLAIWLAALTLTGAAIASPALAQSSLDRNYEAGNYAAPVASAVIGTAVGVGLYNGWYGSSTFATTTLPAASSVAGAVATGGVVGIGAAALIDAAIQPCRGFHAMFMINPEQCVDGQWVGDRPARYHREGRYSRR